LLETVINEALPDCSCSVLLEQDHAKKTRVSFLTIISIFEAIYCLLLRHCSLLFFVRGSDFMFVIWGSRIRGWGWGVNGQALSPGLCLPPGPGAGQLGWTCRAKETLGLGLGHLHSG